MRRPGWTASRGSPSDVAERGAPASARSSTQERDAPEPRRPARVGGDLRAGSAPRTTSRISSPIRKNAWRREPPGVSPSRRRRRSKPAPWSTADVRSRSGRDHHEVVDRDRAVRVGARRRPAAHPTRGVSRPSRSSEPASRTDQRRDAAARPGPRGAAAPCRPRRGRRRRRSPAARQASGAGGDEELVDGGLRGHRAERSVLVPSPSPSRGRPAPGPCVAPAARAARSRLVGPAVSAARAWRGFCSGFTLAWSGGPRRTGVLFGGASIGPRPSPPCARSVAARACAAFGLCERSLVWSTPRPAGVLRPRPLAPRRPSGRASCLRAACSPSPRWLRGPGASGSGGAGAATVAPPRAARRSLGASASAGGRRRCAWSAVPPARRAARDAAAPRHRRRAAPPSRAPPPARRRRRSRRPPARSP